MVRNRARIGENACDRCGGIYYVFVLLHDGYDRYCTTCTDLFRADENLDRGLDADALSRLRTCGILPCSQPDSPSSLKLAQTPHK